MVQGSVPSRDRIFSSLRISKLAVQPIQNFLQWSYSWDVKLTTHLLLELRLRTRGATFPLPLYPLIEGTGTSLPLVNTVEQRLAYHRSKNNDIIASTQQTIENLRLQSYEM